MQMTAPSNAPEVTQLYQDTAEELRQFLLCKIGDAQQADEIAQDCYTKLCRLNHYRDIGSQRCYLFNLAVRLAVNTLGKRQLDGGVPGSSSGVLNQSSGTRGHNPRGVTAEAYRALVTELQTEAIKEALIELSDKTRYIFLLHRYRGLSYSAIARHLGLPVSAIESHMDFALSHIKEAADDFRLLSPRWQSRD